MLLSETAGSYNRRQTPWLLIFFLLAKKGNVKISGRGPIIYAERHEKRNEKTIKIQGV